MTDPEIRKELHIKILKQHHRNAKTLVIDELGLKNGAYRADIAVLSGNLIGYEIKSNRDSLRRLKNQITAYNSVFDRITIVIGERHLPAIVKSVPDFWGIVVFKCGQGRGIRFHTMRRTLVNKNVNGYSIAQLLWKCEAIEVLQSIGVEKKILRHPKKFLYHYLSNSLTVNEIRNKVRFYLMKRENWRYPAQAFPYDDSCQSIAK